jgi:hypothetical protein
MTFEQSLTIEDLQNIISECLTLAQDVNDILDEKNDEAINKINQIISNLELGMSE